ncbi:MAG TPA: DUF4397 domain-containing protein [Ohtaekwangia sp.]
MIKNRVFRSVTAALVVCVALVMTSCDLDGDDVQPIPAAYVTLYNASPNSPELGIVVDGRQINSYPFDYADNTGYLRFYTGNRNIKFSPFGASNAVIDTTVTLKDQHGYSIFVVGQYEQADVVILNDSSSAAAAGKAKIRFVNLSPDAAPVALREKNATSSITENLSFKGASEFIEVDAKEYDFEVVSSGGEPALNLSDINVREGTFRTIIVRGYRTPPSGNTNVISAEIINN